MMEKTSVVLAYLINSSEIIFRNKMILLRKSQVKNLGYWILAITLGFLFLYMIWRNLSVLRPK